MSADGPEQRTAAYAEAFAAKPDHPDYDSQCEVCGLRSAIDNGMCEPCLDRAEASQMYIRTRPVSTEAVEKAAQDLGRAVVALAMKPLPICDSCEQPTDWMYAVQTDPWGRETGRVYCENCAERQWDLQQERLMEET